MVGETRENPIVVTSLFWRGKGLLVSYLHHGIVSVVLLPCTNSFIYIFCKRIWDVELLNVQSVLNVPGLAWVDSHFGNQQV
jgi:hypothetical protein